VKSSLQLQSELLNLLGIKSEEHFFVDGKKDSDTVRRVASEVDLYEVGGCLLRLALSPSDLLWQALDEALHAQLNPLMFSLSSQSSTPPTIRGQIGFHFRCGDTSFAVQSHNRKKNPECWVDTSTASNISSVSSWKGTRFTDDTSMDSPIDYANCGYTLLNSSLNLFNSTASSLKSSTERNELTLLYIASDNPDSSQQINETLLALLLPQWTERWEGKVGLIRPPRACHVDLASNQQVPPSSSFSL